MALCHCRFGPRPGMALIKLDPDGPGLWAPCRACGGTCSLSRCEGAVGGPGEIGNAPNVILFRKKREGR
jgi:hypothetical protein